MSVGRSLSLMSGLVSRNLLSFSPRNLQLKVTHNGVRYLCATASESKDSTTNPKPDDSNHSDTEDKSAELLQTIEKLKADASDFKDKYQRTLADRENVRIRLEKQVADAKVYAVQNFSKDLLEISDVFGKAIESVSQDDLVKGGKQLKELHDGLKMTQTHLHSVFKRHGVSALKTEEGQKFDPEWHEAMFEVPVTDGQKPGSVVHVLREGWKLKDRCLRSAQVGVAKE